MARRVGAQRAGAGLLPEVELSRRRRARVSIGLGSTNGHLDGTRSIGAQQIVRPLTAMFAAEIELALNHDDISY